MTESKRVSSGEAKRVGRFGLVGILNTLLDYILFIGLTKLLMLPLNQVWIAKLISGSVAMVNSYFLNKTWVFDRRHTVVSSEIIKFFAVTVFGVFVIQLGLVQLFSSVLPQPGEWVFRLISTWNLTNLLPQVLTEAFVIKTVAFGLATLASLTWNYLAYKKVVFA
jgi:putative flippase GtrA